VGCGRSRPKSELLRFVRDGDRVVPDPDGRRPGRGAYLCRNEECRVLAKRRRGFHRAFRAPVQGPEDTAIELT
jgi:uncharacterized protein